MKLKSFLSNFYESVIRLFIRRMISAVSVILAAADLPNLDRRREVIDIHPGAPIEKSVLFVIVGRAHTIKTANRRRRRVLRRQEIEYKPLRKLDILTIMETFIKTLERVGLRYLPQR